MTHIPDDIRQLVLERANSQCEYYRIHYGDAVKRHEVDHIIAEKHHGETEPDNLCLSCFICNRYKGSDIASYDLQTRQIVRLFNPRSDQWGKHCQLSGSIIEPLTTIGRVTASLLRFNDPERIIEREVLIRLGKYP